MNETHVSAHPESAPQVPGLFALGWLLFMQPITLHHRLRACGIDRADEGVLRSSYWPDARDCHGAYRGTAAGFIDQALARLRALTAAEIIDGGRESAGQGGPVTYSGPILDGRLAVTTFQAAYEAGRQAKVPLVIGTNSADFIGFISAETKEALFSQFGEGKAKAIAAYDPDGTAELRALLTMAGTDRAQAEPARFTVAEGSGNNPALPTPSRALIPTVNIAPARGWPARSSWSATASPWSSAP